MAAIETLGQPQECRQDSDRLAKLRAQRAITLVRPLGCGAAVIPRHECQYLDFFRLEPAEVAVLDQVVRVPVMARVADMQADVVQERAVGQPLALAVCQPVDASGLVEQRECNPCDLLCMRGPVVATLSQLDGASPPDVGIALDLGDLGSVAVDVVERQPFAQRQVAEHHLVGSEPTQERVEQHRAGDGHIGTPRVEAWDLQALRKIEIDEPSA